jgi:hypothetical protein
MASPSAAMCSESDPDFLTKVLLPDRELPRTNPDKVDLIGSLELFFQACSG